METRCQILGRAFGHRGVTQPKIPCEMAVNMAQKRRWSWNKPKKTHWCHQASQAFADHDQIRDGLASIIMECHRYTYMSRNFGWYYVSIFSMFRTSFARMVWYTIYATWPSKLVLGWTNKVLVQPLAYKRRYLCTYLTWIQVMFGRFVQFLAPTRIDEVSFGLWTCDIITISKVWDCN